MPGLHLDTVRDAGKYEGMLGVVAIEDAELSARVFLRFVESFGR